MNPPINIIDVQHLEPSRYKKVMDGYKVDSIDWSSKYLGPIYMERMLIDQRRGFVKPLAQTNSTDTPTPPHRTSIESTLSLYHIRLWDIIKMIPEEGKCFAYINTHPNHINCLTILEGSYLITQDKEGASN